VEERSASIYRIEEYLKQGTNKKLAPAFAGFLCGLHFNPEDGGSVLFQNVSGLLQDYTVLNPR
jgi:hypothetical protein